MLRSHETWSKCSCRRGIICAHSHEETQPANIRPVPLLGRLCQRLRENSGANSEYAKSRHVNILWSKWDESSIFCVFRETSGDADAAKSASIPIFRISFLKIHLALGVEVPGLFPTTFSRPSKQASCLFKTFFFNWKWVLFFFDRWFLKMSPFVQPRKKKKKMGSWSK